MDRWIRSTATVLASAALAVAWMTAVDLHERVGTSVPNVVLYQNGVLGPPLLTPGGSGYSVRGLRVMDRVVTVDGRPVGSAEEIWQTAAAAGPGVQLAVEALRANGERVRSVITTGLFQETEFLELLLPFLLGGILLVVLGTIPVLVRPSLGTAQVFFVFTVSFTTNFAFLGFDYFYSYRFMPWSYVVSFLAKASLIHLAFVFPVRRWPFTRHARLAIASLYGCLALLSALWVASMYWDPRWMYYLDLLAMPTFIGGFAGLAANLAWTALRSSSVTERQRARVVLAGPALALVAWGFVLASSWAWLDPQVSTPSIILLFWALPISLAFGMLKHNLFEFNTVVRRGINAGVFALAAALAYLAVFTGIQRVAGAGTAWAAAALAGVVVVVLVPLAQPLRSRVQRTVEELLFPDYRRAVKAVHRASRELAHLRDLSQVADHLGEALQQSVQCPSARLVAGRPGERLMELSARSGTDPVPVPEIPGLQDLLRRGLTVNFDEAARGPAGMSGPLRAWLEQAGARMVVPLPPSDTLVGAFLLGKRSDGRLYTSDDEQLVETLAAQSSTAIENAQFFAEVQRLQQRLEKENVYLRRELDLHHDFEEIVGVNPDLKAVLAQVEQVAPTDATVLVLGETGTGKELVVRAIHALSERCERVLVKVACAAIPESLLESELFGHERGAFTGATSAHRGRFEVADGGTLFLDDVDTLPLGIQPKLLRAIQEGEIQRLGGDVVTVDVRIVATSNKNLLAEVQAGRFREDLYYRLNVIPIQIPPLRERPGDVPLLLEFFLERESVKLGKPFRGIAEDAMEELCAYAWPGNVRELRNVVERAAVLCHDDVLRLPGPLSPGPTVDAAAETLPLMERLRQHKIRLITEALEASGGNQRRAAESLGLHRPSLSRMIRDLAIDVPRRSP